MNGSAEIKKASKPFCSLAYLAKSTIAVNGSNDIKMVNCGSNGGQQVSANAKVQDRSNASTPTPSPNQIKLNGHNNNNNNNNNRKEQKNYNNYNSINNGHDNNNNKQKNKLNSLDYEDDVFGIINEEDQLDSCDSGDLRRPWEFSNTYVKRVPPALMTNGLNGHQSTAAHYFHNGHGNLNGGVGSSGLTSLSKLNSLDCWDYTIELECLKGPEDLQLAAELGKTLLERNKELETQLKEYKNLIEEKDQEIVYLKKHSTALREVNESRLKVYEQLEVGVQELERANHRLVVENNNCKKQIKAFVQNGESLENRCEELTKQLEDLRQTLTAERRKNERMTQERHSLGTEAARIKSETEQNLNTSHLAVDTSHLSVSGTGSFVFQSPNGARNSTGISSNSGNEEQGLDMSIVGGASGIPGLEGEDNEEIIKIVNDLESTKKAYMAEQQRCAELEEQLVAIIQENQTLQTRIAQSSTNEEMRSMQEELSILDEVRQGQMCSRCLRAVDDRATLNDEQSSLAPTEEVAEEDYDERSLLDMEGSTAEGADVSESNELNKSAYRSSVSIKMSNRTAVSLDLNANGNPYRDLVEKYEALLEVQRSSLVRKTSSLNQSTNVPENATSATGHCDGTSSCNGSTTNEPNTNNAGNNGSGRNTGQRGRTPCEFSEAETSSSGFSDETSNKSTQTDDRPGYFLCSIGDGEDCKFSIYDDVSPIDSRFRNRPEYRELFKEIFAVLKKAAENKEEGDKLPLLDDTHPAVVTTANVPPVTPANEELPMEFADDSQSIISSAVSEQSFAMSECITKLERKTAKKHITEKNQENKPPLMELEASLSQLAMTSGVCTEDPNVKPIVENGRILTPLKREPLEYLMVGVGIKKKGRNRKNRNFSNDRSESPVALPSPPRFYVGSGKKRRPLNVNQSPGSPAGSGAQTPIRGNQGAKFEWNGSSMVIYNRGMSAAQRARDFDVGGMEYRPSTVSQDLHKLKKLDLSYAEVLRRADSCKHHTQHNNYQTPTTQNRRRTNRHQSNKY